MTGEKLYGFLLTCNNPEDFFCFSPFKKTDAILHDPGQNLAGDKKMYTIFCVSLQCKISFDDRMTMS